jgi:TRAP-type uncharacterized transport system substrate-binding protein
MTAMTRRMRYIISLSAVLGLTGIETQAVAQQSSVINRGVVELETAGTSGISVRIGEELANLIDDGATRRLVPVVGKGALQNLIDLKYLRGIDMAILPADIIEYAKEQKLISATDPSIYYIAKLYNEEFHLLARGDIKIAADLSNRKVNVGPRGSSSAITAARLFEQLGLPVTFTYEPQELALEALRNAETAAVALLSGKPAPLLQDLKDEGLHLVDIPFSQSAGHAYVPATLTATDYPRLIQPNRPVKTVAVGSVLAVAELRLVPERNRNVMNFVDVFFTGFASLLERGHHPKWQEVNVAADLPGWVRYPAAEQWLQRNPQIAKAPSVDELRLMFARFIDQRREAAGENPMAPQEKGALFQQFRAWQTGQAQ